MTSSKQDSEKTISGIDVMRGVGASKAKPFWADAWSRVVERRGAQFGLLWIGIIGFFAIFAPVLANGLPIWTIQRNDDGEIIRSWSPMLDSLTSTDILLLIGGVLVPILLLLPLRATRQWRLGLVCAFATLAGSVVVLIAFVQYLIAGSDPDVLSAAWLPWTVSFAVSAGVLVCLFWLVPVRGVGSKLVVSLILLLLTSVICADRWVQPVVTPERFVRGERDGTMDNIYTVVPWSPTQSEAIFYSRRPTTTVSNAYLMVAEEQVDDGIAFFIRTVVFNISPRIEGLAISTDARSNLVEFVASGDREMVPGLVEAGMSDLYIARFLDLSTGLQAYREGIDEGDVAKATDAADAAVTIVTGIEAASRNSKIMIVDASEELRDKVEERIGFVQDAEARSDDSYGRRDFHLGTDPIGRDVLTQMMHACRLSISIGLVSTGISVVIGIVIGSLMGYFGGWVDLVLSRIVEIFMAIPVLFLLIVAASALPRNTYVMMAIIGCVTWTGSARFIRAEFLKLRNQDFVQSCRAVGLPLHSTLFRHMLPNGITPVLVQASFGIAAAIIAEATLSYLGLGPYGQSSWGKLLSLTTGETGVFLWWMAVFPGVAIFLTVLAYNVLGENFRDAIDPKMRKAAH